MNELERVYSVFRKKLGHRSFARDEGHMQQMRDLLEARDRQRVAGRLTRTGWMLAALVPLGALSWWAFAGKADPVTAVPPSVPVNAEATQGAGEAAALSMDHTPTSPVISPAAQVANGTNNAVRPAERPTADKARQHKATARTHERSGRAGMNTRSADRAAHVAETAPAMNQPATEASVHSPEHSLMLGYRAQRLALAPTASLIDEHHWLQRTLTPQVPWESMPTPEANWLFPRRHIDGELQLVAALFNARTDWDESRTSTAPGNSFGLEYRLRRAHFSFASGIHYASRTLLGPDGQDTRNTANIRINHIEVPLLVGYERVFGAWGVGGQAGIGVDFLFNAAGYIPPTADRPSSKVPDGAFKSVGYALHLRPQVRYAIMPRLALCAGPVWQHGLSSLASEGPFAEARSNRVGLQLGLTWRLERITY